MTRAQLKSFFSTGKKPTQGQFASLIDTFVSKDEDTIQIGDVNGLGSALAGKASADVANSAYTIAQEALAAAEAGGIVPGGTTGQVLKKTSNANGAVAWGNQQDISGKADTTVVEGYVNNLAANIGNLQDGLDLKANSSYVNAAVAGLEDTDNTLLTAIGTKQTSSEKNQPGGYAGLDGSGKVAAAQLPSYVDDVIEVDNYAALPGTGETGKMYVTKDANKVYRWSGSGYIEIVASPGSTDEVAEGITNKYFLAVRVFNAVLAGLSFLTNAAIADGDSVLAALGKLQAQITSLFSTKLDNTGGTITGNLGVTNNFTAKKIILEPDGVTDLQDWYIISVAPSGGNPGYKKLNYRKLLSNGTVLSDNQLWYMDDGRILYGVYPKMSEILTENRASELPIITDNNFDCALYRAALWIPTSDSDLTISNLPTGSPYYQLQIVVKNADDLANTLALTINGQTSPAVPVAPTGLTHILIDVVAGAPTYSSDYNPGGSPASKSMFTGYISGEDAVPLYAGQPPILVPLPNVVIDTDAAWNAANNYYVIPKTAFYRIIINSRSADFISPSGSYLIEAGVDLTTNGMTYQSIVGIVGNGRYGGGAGSYVKQFIQGDFVSVYGVGNNFYLSICELTIEEL